MTRPLSTLACLLLVLTPGSAWAQDAGPHDPEAGASSDADADSASPAPADPIEPERLPSVEARLAADHVELGATVTLSIRVSHRSGDRVHLRSVRTLGPFEVADSRRTPLESDDGRSSELLEIDLQGFEPGEHEVPAVELLVVLSDGRTGRVATPTFPLVVTDPLANEPDPQPRADHEPVVVYTTDRRLLWIGGALVAAIALLGTGLLLGQLRGRRKPKPAPPPPPPRPAEEVALEKLEAVERSGMLERGEVKEFHSAVSEAVREYLGGRYRFDSLELTTEELFAELDQVDVRGVTRPELERLIGDTDLVKFAKWRPDEEQSRGVLELAYAIVRRTTEAEMRRPAELSGAGDHAT